MHFFSQVISLNLPILSAGLFLIIVIKKNWFSFLNRPIDGGRNSFGANKTWRGIACYLTVATLVTALLHLCAESDLLHPIFQINPLIVGLCTSGAYVAGELVNSFIKRRLGKPPGVHGGKIQSFFDNVDGALAAGLVLFLQFGVRPEFLVASFVMTLILHEGTDYWMRKLGLKSSK